MAASSIHLVEYSPVRGGMVMVMGRKAQLRNSDYVGGCINCCKHGRGQQPTVDPLAACAVISNSYAVRHHWVTI